MNGITASSSAALTQAALAQTETQNKLDMAVLKKSQEIATQQGMAAVELIKAASDASESIIDVRA